MHQKKRKLHKLHSIPIKLRSLCTRARKNIISTKSPRISNKRLYLVSYSIPLSCMVVLLLGGVVAINPSLPLKTNAITIQDEWVVKDNENDNDGASEYNSNPTVLEDASEDVNTNKDIDNNTADDIGNPDADIIPFSIASDSDSAPTPSISITVSAGAGGNGGGVDQVVNAFQSGSTVYRSHNVTVQGTMLKDYSLVLTGPTNLTMPSGASSSTSTISGAGGKTGSNMTTNTWGYAWGNTTDTDSNMTYNSLSSSGATISNNSTNSIGSDKSLNFTKKLVFAAKFGDVTPGNYTANVTLSAVATPAVSMSTISNMQDMTAEICSGSDVGQTAILTDSRSGYSSGTITGASGKTHNLNQYEIVKHSDGNCWMQENLRIGGGSAVVLTPNDTDITISYTLPASSDTSWNSGDEVTGNGQIRVGKSGMAVSSAHPGDGKGWQPLYGNYYSWCAATAGTCAGAPNKYDIAKGSICPKNWKIPTGYAGSATEVDNQFYGLFGQYGNKLGSTSAERLAAVRGAPYYFSFAGEVRRGDFQYPGAMAYYSSSTSADSTGVFHFAIGNGQFGTTGEHNWTGRADGLSVRCIVVSGP